MNIGVLLLGIIILGIEPLVLGFLLPHYDITTILTGIGLTNLVLMILYAIRWHQTTKKTKKDEPVVGRNTASYLFFPTFILMTLTVDAYLLAIPNIYGHIAMLAGAVVFFSTLIIGYQTIHTNGVYWGKRKIMPKDYVFWICLMIASFVRFLLGDMWCTFKAMISLWVLFLLMYISIRGMKLIQKTSIWKLIGVKFSFVLAIIATLVSAIHTYMLITDNKANFTDIPTLFHTGVQNIFSSNKTLSGQNSSNSGAVVVGTSALMTGHLLSGTIDTQLSGNTTTETSLTGVTVNETGTVTVVETEEDTNLSELPDGPLTYRSVLTYLINEYDLAVLRNSPTRFKNIRMSDEDYEIFNIAAQHRFIGTNLKPESKVSCQTYIVLKGLAANRNVSTDGSPFGPYWEEAEKRDEINGCTWNTSVTKENL